ncbi:MAG: zinc ribbon domain-containing protein [Firmicutes bacterium]|nr:zinc ribbon domain-containing protein [Bacillota bacterium]
MKCPNCGYEDEGRFCSNCGKPLSSLPAQTHMPSTTDPGKWQICISFSKSTSPNFARALAMAKAAPQFIESVDEFGNTVYQAIYDAEHYLQFVALYELISNWKSCFVFINNQMVDRKIIGSINYCYGDKVRSGNPNFCFGASEWTENPFGCHRAQMHRGKDPWYSFGHFDASGKFRVDIERIINELLLRLEPYKYCPALDINDVVRRAQELPRVIDPRIELEWDYTTYYLADGSTQKGIIPKKYSYQFRHDIVLSLDDLDIDESKRLHKQAQLGKTGCLLPTLVMVMLMVLLVGLF